jgi:endogenous inhibitor of DNA gyrase (YacG/DUF329 family)
MAELVKKDESAQQEHKVNKSQMSFPASVIADKGILVTLLLFTLIDSRGPPTLHAKRIMIVHCPICRQEVEPRESNKAFPFCSLRCRRVDLGNWFAEGYVSSRPIDPDKDGDALMDAVDKEDAN